GHGDVHLELVPRDAPLASITGRAFDAANGAPIPIPWDYDVDVLPIDDDLPLDVLRGDLLPNHAIPISRQQFDMGHHPEPSEAFTLDGLERRRVVLRLKVPGYAPEFLGPFDLAERPVVDDVVARLHRPGTLSGRVLDAAGNPVANAYLVVTGAGPRSTDRMDTLDAVVRAIGGGGAPLPDAQTRTREDGRFSLHGLPIGLPLRVVALHATHARGATGVVVLREGATRDGLEVRLGAERER